MNSVDQHDMFHKIPFIASGIRSCGLQPGLLFPGFPSGVFYYSWPPWFGLWECQ
jgi:hypothetical protein